MNRGAGPRLLRILEWGFALCANGLDSPHLTTLQWFRARLTKYYRNTTSSTGKNIHARWQRRKHTDGGYDY